LALAVASAIDVLAGLPQDQRASPSLPVARRVDDRRDRVNFVGAAGDHQIPEHHIINDVEAQPVIDRAQDVVKQA
jgi:hypothetical protein